MPRHCLGRIGAATLLGGLLLTLTAGCEQQPPPLAKGHKVQGKGSYKGDPVPSGFVLFYSQGHSLNGKDGSAVPAASGEIIDGKYEIPSAPEGPVTIVVATDPDLDLFHVMKPRGGPVPGGPPTGPPGG